MLHIKNTLHIIYRELFALESPEDSARNAPVCCYHVMCNRQTLSNQTTCKRCYIARCRILQQHAKKPEQG